MRLPAGCRPSCRGRSRRLRPIPGAPPGTSSPPPTPPRAPRARTRCGLRGPLHFRGGRCDPEGRRQEGAPRFWAPGRAAGGGARRRESRLLRGHSRANSDTCSLTRRMSPATASPPGGLRTAQAAQRAPGREEAVSSLAVVKAPGRRGTPLLPPSLFPAPSLQSPARVLPVSPRPAVGPPPPTRGSQGQRY